MSISGIDCTGLLNYGFNSYPASNCLYGLNCLSDGSYLNGVNCFMGGNIDSNTVSFQKAIENILKDYVKEDKTVENNVKQKNYVQTEPSWWELRSERSEALKEQSESYYLKTQEYRKWERQQARKEEREALKAEYQQIWRYV